MDGNLSSDELQAHFKFLSLEADAAGLVDFSLLGMKERFFQGIGIHEPKGPLICFKGRFRGYAGKPMMGRFVIMVLDPQLQQIVEFF